jgi:hypothetical protein
MLSYVSLISKEIALIYHKIKNALLATVYQKMPRIENPKKQFPNRTQPKKMLLILHTFFDRFSLAANDTTDPLCRN